MAHQVTPSKRKFKIAKAFAEELHKIYGNDLKAVFVVGSIAANLALPKSDVDLVYVFSGIDALKDFHNAGKIPILQADFKVKYKTEVNADGLERVIFESLGKKLKSLFKFDYSILITSLQRGAVPIFGKKEYLRKFKGIAFGSPNLESIRARYANSGKSRTLFERIQLKRSKKGSARFLPR